MEQKSSCWAQDLVCVRLCIPWFSYKSTTVRYAFLASASSPATQTSAKSISEKQIFPFLPHEHLVNQLKVSFALFVYAQTHNRAATELMSITLGAGSY